MGNDDKQHRHRHRPAAAHADANIHADSDANAISYANADEHAYTDATSRGVPALQDRKLDWGSVLHCIRRPHPRN